jgi:hypothetical protein
VVVQRSQVGRLKCGIAEPVKKTGSKRALKISGFKTNAYFYDMQSHPLKEGLKTITPNSHVESALPSQHPFCG